MLPTKPKSDEEIFRDQWVKMHELSWLFPQHFELDAKSKKNRWGQFLGPTSSEDYIGAFSRNAPMFNFKCLCTYKFSLLEKYKDKVALSSHFGHGGIVIPYTVLQIDAEKGIHAVVDWAWDKKESEFMFAVTLFVRNQQDYGVFMRENAVFERPLREENRAVGFQNRDEN